MNKVLLVGRIATDPTSRATSSNVQVSNFSVACNGSFSKANQQNNTVFVPCVAWNNQANFVQTYLKKGSLVGKINILENNKLIMTKDLIIKENINKANIFILFKRNIIDVSKGNI